MEASPPRDEGGGRSLPACPELGSAALLPEQLEAAAISPLLSRIPVQYNQRTASGALAPFPSPLDLPSVDSPSQQDCRPGAPHAGQHGVAEEEDFDSGSNSPTAVARTPVPKKETALRCIFPRKRTHVSAGVCLVVQGGKLSSIMTPDILLMILSCLKEPEILLSMSVCKEWRRIAGSTQLWASKGEREPEEGKVNWPAFKFLGVLREKKHSMVIKCQSRVTQDTMVVKRILTRVNPSTGEAQEQAVDQGFPVRYLREVSLLRACDHPNVMKLRFVSYHGCNLQLFSDFVGQNVEDFVSSLGKVYYTVGTPENAATMETCRNYMLQILDAVHYCHSVGIILRDIKPRNVMIDHRDSSRVKLTGFALGRFASLPAEPLTREVVTLSYRAPEILLGGANPVYSAPIDLWSVGCTMAEIASGRTLFEGDSEIGQLFCIFRLLGTPTEDVWPGLSLLPDFLANPPRWPKRDLRVAGPGLCADGLDLLSKMLQYHPASRITAKEARRHPYFTKHPAPQSPNRTPPRQTSRAAAAGMCTPARASGCASRALQCGGRGPDRVEKEVDDGGREGGEGGAAAAATQRVVRSLRGGGGGSGEAAAHRQAEGEDVGGEGAGLAVQGWAAGEEGRAAAAEVCTGHLLSESAGGSYGSDLHATLLRNEAAHLPSPTYATSHQTRGFATMRRILVEWLVEVVEEAGMKCETLHLAVNYLDRYLAERVVAREELQLVGITAILVASKHEELAPQSVQNLVIMTDNTYEHADVLKTERDLLGALDYHLTVLTPLRALELLRLHTLQDPAWERERERGSDTWGSQLQTDTWVLSAFLLELAMAELREVSGRASALTAAAALLAVHSYEWAWRGSSEASGGGVEAERGAAGPAFTIVARHVVSVMGPLLQEGGGGGEPGLESIGNIMWRLHGYHCAVLPTFATFRKYVAPNRLGVALRPPSPSSSLPRSVDVNGVRYNLAPSAQAS